MSALVSHQRSQYQENMLAIKRLQDENRKLETEFVQSMSDSYQTSWEFLEAFLDDHLRTSAYVRTAHPPTLKDCKLRMDTYIFNLQEVVRWYIVLPLEYRVFSSWPKIDVTNKHYLLRQHYDTGFIRYLTDKKLIEVENLLTE